MKTTNNNFKRNNALTVGSASCKCSRESRNATKRVLLGRADITLRGCFLLKGRTVLSDLFPNSHHITYQYLLYCLECRISSNKDPPPSNYRPNFGLI